MASSIRVPGSTFFVELIRLALIVLGTAIAFQLTEDVGVEQTARIGIVALCVGLGYVVGGVLGRFIHARIAKAERGIKGIPTSELLAGLLGGFVGLTLGFGIIWPALVFPAKMFTVPIAAAIAITLVWAGWVIGRARVSDLMRMVGVGGRLPTGSRASGQHFKLVDTSTLIDGRIVEVCRNGWVEGVLGIPTFVLYELQGLADSGETERRTRGRRGLDSLSALQRLSSVAIQVLEEDPPPTEVDTKLVFLAKERDMALLTTDTNLARVAEVQGVRVLNLHELADTLRPPVVPGDELQVRVAKTGRESGQGVGYLPDGTMVVVESGEEAIGATVPVEVTSIMSTNRGRMLFATMIPPESIEESAS